MKIISMPEDNSNNWNTLVVCIHCDATLEVRKSDIRYTGFWDEAISDYECQCLNCKQWLDATKFTPNFVLKMIATH